MSESMNHTVFKISWDTSFDDKVLSPRLQDRLSDWSRNRMLAEISAVFDKLCPPHQIWRIPALDINLGVLDWTNLERGLEERFQRTLTKQLEDLLLYAGIGDKRIEILEGVHAQVEVIRHYLIHGYLPWNHEALGGSINALMSHQFQVNPVGLGSMLERVGEHHEDVRKRMAWQLDESNLMGTIRVLEPQHHEQMVALSEELSTLQEKESIVPSSQADFKRNLWLWVLTYLYMDRGTLFNRVAFMKHHILHMARHYHLSFEALFTLIVEAVEAVGKKRKITADFLLAIQAIAKEMKFIGGDEGASATAVYATATSAVSAVDTTLALAVDTTLALAVDTTLALAAVPSAGADSTPEARVWTHLLKLATSHEPIFRSLIDAAGIPQGEVPIDGLLILKEKLEGPHSMDTWCDLLGADYPSSSRTVQTMDLLLDLWDKTGQDRRRVVYQLIKKLYKGIKESDPIRIWPAQKALQWILLRTPTAIWGSFPDKEMLRGVWDYIGTSALEAHLGSNMVNEEPEEDHSRGEVHRTAVGEVHRTAIGESYRTEMDQGSWSSMEASCLSLLEVARRSGQWTTFTDALLIYGQMPEGLDGAADADDTDDADDADGGSGLRYVAGGTGIPGARTRVGRTAPGTLIKIWLSNAPADFIATLSGKALPKRQMEWLSAVITFKELSIAIGQTERGLKPVLKTLEAFYQGLGNCAIGPVSAKELQGILFWKVMKAWRSKNWRSVTPAFIWNNLVWDLTMRRGLDLKIVTQYFRTRSVYFPYPIPAENTKMVKKAPNLNLSAKENRKEAIRVKNAGVVLLNAYMVMMFERLGLCKDKQWIGEQQAMDAVHYLQFLVTGHSHTEEAWLPLNKLLCGLSLSHPVPEGVDMSDGQRAMMEGLIRAAIGYWPAIGSCTIQGFRGNWLVRDGLLSELEGKWELTVEKRAYDLLIDKSPFTFSIIRLPWMNKPLHVKWNY